VRRLHGHVHRPLPPPVDPSIAVILRSSDRVLFTQAVGNFVLNFFTTIPEFRPDWIACSAQAVRGIPPFPFNFATVRVCACVRISEDDMRQLYLFACLCLLTLSGAAGPAKSDQVPSDAAAATVESSQNTTEQTAPRSATAKPVVQRSKREVCDTLIESAKSNDCRFHFSSTCCSRKAASSLRGEPGRRARHRAIYARDSSGRRPR